jgi:hypothetical protein
MKLPAQPDGFGKPNEIGYAMLGGNYQGHNRPLHRLTGMDQQIRRSGHRIGFKRRRQLAAGDVRR